MQRRIVDTDTGWFENANCKGKTKVFFVAVSDTPSDKRLKERQAAQICAECSVISQCREYARRNGEHGFWGGESEEQRFGLGFLNDPVMQRRQRARDNRLKNR